MTNRTCTAPDCGKPRKARGYCTGHYTQLARGRSITPLADRSRTPEQRFEASVDRSSPGGCWLWTGNKMSIGYGSLWVEGRRLYAHRLAYEWAKGAIPAGMLVDHICHERLCVNPEHLRLVDRSGNGQNRSGAQVNSTSGVRGVHWDKRDKRWVAYAHLSTGKKHLGMFLSKDEAEATVVAWRAANMPLSAKDQAAAEYAERAIGEMPAARQIES